MKAFVKSFSFIIAIILTILCTSAVPFSAADDFKAGDTVTYYVKMQTDKMVDSIRFTVTYNPNTLEIDKSSINFPYVETNTCNAETSGKIIVMVMNQDGYDFKKEQQLITVTFKLKDGYKDGDVSFAMNDLLDVNLEVIANSEFTIKEEVKSGSIPKEQINNPGDLLVKRDGDNTVINNEQSKPEIKETDPFIYIIIGVGAAALLIIIAVIIVNVRKNRTYKLKENTTESNNQSDNASRDK